MENAIYCVTVRCVSPDGDPHRHQLFVLADGTVVTPDHDEEDWAQSLGVMEALGGEGDISACVWWRRGESLAAAPAGWSNGNIVVLHDTGGERVIARYDVRDWEIETLDEWTIGSRSLMEQRLGLSRGATPNSWWSWARGQATPDEILSYLQRIPSDQLDGTPQINYVPLVRLIETLEASDETLEDWMASGQHWASILEWKHNGYTAEETVRFCEAYRNAMSVLQERFSSQILQGMVFHTPVTLAASLADGRVDKERALRLLEWAPQVIYPDWPGVAESAMPPIPSDIPQQWVIEALSAIPAAGFLPEIDRSKLAKKLAQSLPQRFAKNGDPLTWDPQWCWPEGTAANTMNNDMETT